MQDGIGLRRQDLGIGDMLCGIPKVSPSTAALAWLAAVLQVANGDRYTDDLQQQRMRIYTARDRMDDPVLFHARPADLIWPVSATLGHPKCGQRPQSWSSAA